MSGRRILIGFYIPRAAVASWEAARSQLGLDDTGLGTLTPVAVGGESTPDYHIVYAYFLEVDFLALREAHAVDGPLPLEDDGALRLAQSVRLAAVRAGATAAVILTHSLQATPAWLRDHEWMVMVNDAGGLAGEFAGMLWLADVPDSVWHTLGVREGRDELRDGPGRTLFAGSGWSRWY